MMREAELEELEKQWREQNDAIMREFPRIDDDAGAAPAPSAPATTGSSSEPTATGPTETAPTDGDIDQDAAANPPETHAKTPRARPLPRPQNHRATPKKMRPENRRVGKRGEKTR